MFNIIKILGTNSLMLLSIYSYGQYDEIRFPQAKSEIMLLKSLKVKEKIKKSGASVNAFKTALKEEYDTNGMIIRKIQASDTRVYKYDSKLRLIMMIDSIKNGTDWDRIDYEFEYDSKGVLNFARLGQYNSSFAWDSYAKKLSESTLVDYESYRERFYYFNKGDKLISEEFMMPQKVKEKKRKLSYDSKNRLSSEFTIKYLESGGIDSSVISYKYDEKGNLEYAKTKSRISYPLDLSNPAMSQPAELDSFRYNYKYNSSNNLIAETYTYSDPRYSYVYDYKVESNGLRIGEKYMPGNGKLSLNSYEYRYYPNEQKNKGIKKAGK